MALSTGSGCRGRLPALTSLEQDGASPKAFSVCKLLKGLVGTAGFEPTTSTV